jgi:hypothetical protein
MEEGGLVLTQERIKELLDYDPDTGIFKWKISKARSIKVNNIAGGAEQGKYHRIRIDGKNYVAHRLAWLYVYGKWPDEYIDHINCIKNDNRIKNLREATNSQNQTNVLLRSNNTSGYKGVIWNKQNKKWQAYISVNYSKTHLGYFDNIEDAASAYKKAANVLHGEFNQF